MDSIGPRTTIEYGSRGIIEADLRLPILPVFEEQLLTTTALLQQARLLARDVDCDPWSFAVEVAHLRAYGVPDILLKWLIIRGYVNMRNPEGRAEANGASFPEPVRIADGAVLALTPEGEVFADQVTSGRAPTAILPSSCARLEMPTEGLRPHHLQLDRREATIRPHWDVVCKRLWYADKLVKQFKLPSVNQETVLMAFEEEGWTQRVDDPLPQQPNQNPHIRLGNTIKALNRNQKNKLLQFRGDGSGEGVLWEPCTGGG